MALPKSILLTKYRHSPKARYRKQEKRRPMASSQALYQPFQIQGSSGKETVVFRRLQASSEYLAQVVAALLCGKGALAPDQAPFQRFPAGRFINVPLPVPGEIIKIGMLYDPCRGVHIQAFLPERACAAVLSVGLIRPI